MQEKEEKHLWYKTAIFYAVIVELFYDGNGDGVGDFNGLTEKLSYFSDLGVTCIWLLPFYPTMYRDNGYDVTDYKAVDDQLGTMDDFKRFIKEAKKRNIRVIIDLVVHHTSDEHAWFKKSKKNDSKFKDYYIWTKNVPEGKQPDNAFPGVEAGVWKLDGDTKEFYYHSFYSFEPDLNIANKNVQEEIEDIMKFWMRTGIDGFRMDAATLMFDRKGLPGTEVKDLGKLMEHWNGLVKSFNPDGILLGEADVGIDKIGMFFGNGGRMDLLYNFLLNRHIFLSFAKNDATPIQEFMKKLPVPPFTAQWVNFLRNHDELNIGQLPKEDKELIFKIFAPDQGMRVYDRGIRRRLAPMFNNNLERLKMAYSLLFSLPGAIMLLYGDEIGMGDDLRIPERQSIRLPMQWDGTENAGFSSINPSAIIRDVKDTGDFSYQEKNVVKELSDPNSLLNHIKHLIQVFHTHHHIGHGTYTMIHVHPSTVLGIAYDFEGETIIILNNLSSDEQFVDLEEYKPTKLEEFYSDGNYSRETSAMHILIHAYGYRWFRVRTND